MILILKIKENARMLYFNEKAVLIGNEVIYGKKQIEKEV